MQLFLSSMANVTPINATIANSTAAILGGAANGLSFVPAVLEKHCRIIPDPLKRDGTFCSRTRCWRSLC